MSIERVERKDGSVVWRVRWRQAGQSSAAGATPRPSMQSCAARKRIGELAALDAGKETLAECGEEWWKLYAEPNLAATTLKVYAILWDTHVLPRSGRSDCGRSHRRSSLASASSSRPTASGAYPSTRR